nr:hypothetical protein Itr_chr12CG14470 [Ipomoea trifida]
MDCDDGGFPATKPIRRCLPFLGYARQRHVSLLRREATAGSSVGLCYRHSVPLLVDVTAELGGDGSRRPQRRVGATMDFRLLPGGPSRPVRKAAPVSPSPVFTVPRDVAA